MVKTKVIKKEKKVSKPKVRSIKKKGYKGIKVIYRDLSNKSRKGTYAYVKEYKKKGRYYKVQPSIGKKDLSYKKVYQLGGFKSKKGITPEIVKRKKIVLKEMKKAPIIEDHLTSGYAQTTILNANKSSPFADKISYRKLLMNSDKVNNGNPVFSTRDGKLREIILELLTLPENIEKWKFRIQYKVNLIDNENDVICSLVPDNVKTLSDIRKEMLGSIIIGQEFSSMYRDLGEKAKLHGYQMTSKEAKKKRVVGVNIVMSYKKS